MNSHRDKRAIFSILFLASLPLPPAVAAPFEASGRVASTRGEAMIGAGVAGVVEQISVAVGQRVRQGDALLHIRCAIQEASARASEATATAAQAVAARVRNGPRPEEIAAGEADVGYAKAVSEEADLAFRRAQALVQGVTITVAAYLDAERNARVAAARLEEAKAELALLRAGSRAEDIEASDAWSKAALAEADRRRAELAECTIRAPFDGVVVGRSVGLGQYVSTALSQTLLRISDDRDLIVAASLGRARLAELCANQTATITIEAPRKLTASARLQSALSDASSTDAGSVVLRPDEPLPPDFLGAQVSIHFAACNS